MFLETVIKTCLINVKTSLNKKERSLLFLYEKELTAYFLNGTCSQEKLEALNQKLFGACDAGGREKLEPILQRICQSVISI